MVGVEILISEDVCLVDLYHWRGEWFAGFAVIRGGTGQPLQITDTLTIITPETGIYNNLPLPHASTNPL